jgi:hypothetical protein
MAIGTYDLTAMQDMAVNTKSNMSFGQSDECQFLIFKSSMEGNKLKLQAYKLDDD